MAESMIQDCSLFAKKLVTFGTIQLYSCSTAVHDCTRVYGRTQLYDILKIYSRVHVRHVHVDLVHMNHMYTLEYNSTQHVCTSIHVLQYACMRNN